MKRLLSLGLAALLALTLAGCGGQDPADETPASTQTPETAPAQTIEAALPAVAGDFYAVHGAMGDNSLFNAGNVLYELRPRYGYCLIYKIDCATATKQVLCSVPGCTHDSEACPAWLPGQIWDYTTFATEDTVYVYKARSEEESSDWDSYYQQNVAPYLDDEAMLQGRTPQEFETYYRNWFTQLSQPACLYAVQRDGTARKRIDLSENLERNISLSWCDGTAVYGCQPLTAMDAKVQGYRVDLATGKVTTFAMLPGESILAAEGRRLLTTRAVSDVPFPDPQTDWEAYQAVLQNATLECTWLDPATGTRDKLMELPGSLIAQGGNFCGMAGGQLYFVEQQMQPPEESKPTAILAFDTATGQQKDLLRPLPQANTWLNDPTVVGLPGIAQQEGRYLWMLYSGTDNASYMQILDCRSGTLYDAPSTSKQAAYQQARGCLPLTDDGRFLLCVGQSGEFYDSEYALIDAEAFLQGSTDYTPVTEVP